ncbi:hypothetical protein N5F13_23195 [Comamonas thiooxydans]|uniref:hypothetical protein n=1 Tax=Comamonas thiooxydans TaxID=363952 RepID=UPI002449E814|nr:hypothetical protein [Comamonas thiooxydans]MDH1477407.1 hypothetical protein [Comamonas thiooxydans]
MLNISRTGQSLADMANQVRGVPARLIPYATATALTRCAKQAQVEDLPQAMRKAFDNPTSYTLNALRIEPATKNKLSARVLVKTKAMTTGNAPESYLQPEVEGGQRGSKRMENALRYAGLLTAGQFVVPGAATSLDANGNVKGTDIRTILKALKNLKAVSATRSRSGQRLAKGRQLANQLFVGKPQGGNRPDGIWRREGKRLRPLFVFTNSVPTYRPRLDFSGVVQGVARKQFPAEFAKAVASMKSKGRW